MDTKRIMIMNMERTEARAKASMNLMTSYINRLFPNRNVKTRIKWLVTLSY